MTKSYLYKTCGLGIESSFELPELLTAEDILPDVSIRAGNVGSFAGRNDPVEYFDVTSDRAYLYWPEIGAFLTRNGSEVIVEPRSDVEPSLLRLALLGPVLSTIITQQGQLGLHASAVVINGEAVAFVGESGQGKSTLAAALHRRGHAVLADDMVVVDIKGMNGQTGMPMVLPSYPQLKLFPESIRASLGDDPETLPLLMAGLDKRARYSSKGFTVRPVPLNCIYVLETDDATMIEPIPGQEKIVNLVRQSYGAGIFKYWLKGSAAVLHFQKCAKLAAKVRICRLKRPHSFAMLSDVAQMVEDSIELNGFIEKPLESNLVGAFSA